MVAAPHLEAYERYLATCAEKDPDMYKQLQRAIHTVETMVTLVGQDALALSYNGGKDAAAAMHILRFVLMRRTTTPDVEVLNAMKVLFFDTTDEFREVEEHVDAMAQKYQLRYIKYDCSYKEGMQNLVENRGVKAVVMGVRVGDPFTADAEHIIPSTPGWPIFLRVYPILMWDYGSVWKFLRSCGIPYCPLYDQGYTSIGKSHNTVKNRALLRAGSESEYHPAYELMDYSLERANRAGATGQDTTCVFKRTSSLKGDIARIGVVVIGDEILTGQVQDQNLPYLCRELDALGAEVAEACILPDNQLTIARHVAWLSGKCDYVITTGGIGPTHDDVTFHGIARAFDVEMEQNQAMMRVLLEKYGHHSKYLKFAHLPAGAEIQELDEVRYPVICVRNVFCLPGVPELMKEQFEALRQKFSSVPLFRQHVQLACDEADVAVVLHELQQKFQSVKIGSYPVDVPASTPGDETTLKRITVAVQGRDEASVHAASRELDTLLRDSSYA